MPHNSITRLRLRSLFSLPAFARETRVIAEQLRAAPGFLGGAVLAEGRLVFWTRSAWESTDAMKAFRDTGAHRDSMPKLVDWCDEAAVAQCDGEVLTDWKAIHTFLSEKGRLSRVRKPTKAHQEKRFARMVRWSPEQVIAPLNRRGG